MRFSFKKFSAVILTAAAALAFSACSGQQVSAVSPELAKTLMETYLEDKGFGENDFLAEDNIMEINDVKVYVYAWRTKEGENADRLLGMFAVSVDGKTYYEYQSARNEWIKDMNT